MKLSVVFTGQSKRTRLTGWRYLREPAATTKTCTVSLAISSILLHLPFFDLLTEDNGQSKILVVHPLACDEAELQEL